MKSFALILIAISVFALAGAVYLYTQNPPGRYEVTSVAGLSGVYRIDTVTGDISICSPVYENGCMSLEEAYRNIVRQRENVQSKASEAAENVREFFQNLGNDEKDQPPAQEQAE